jgi:hypothetical protein
MAWRSFLAIPAALLVVMASRPARCDFIALRNGGEIRGELLTDPRARNAGELVSIRTLSGAVVTVEKQQVDDVVRRRMVLEEYETLRRAAPDALEAQWQLAEWCRAKNLSKERQVHLARVVEIDPDHVQAHRGLGHVRDAKGRWATRDEVMAARGFVKYRGKYILPQELQLILADEKVSEAEKSWFKRVKMWHGWLDGERQERRIEAAANLRSIKDPDAVPALARSFKTDENEANRLMYVEVIGKMAGDKPIRSLVLQSLWDESREVRESSIRGIQGRDVTKALPLYLRALKNSVNVVVNRAGDALGLLGNESVIPQLIEALVTRHTYTVLVPNPPPGVPTDGSNMVPVGTQVLPPQIELLLSTGRIPGVIMQTYPGFGPRMREETIEKDEENIGVLTALTLLTGENLGYDEPAWRKWYNAKRNGGQTPARKRKSLN